MSEETLKDYLYILKEDLNAYVKKEYGTYEVKKTINKKPFNIHKEFFKITKDEIEKVELFKH